MVHFIDGFARRAINNAGFATMRRDIHAHVIFFLRAAHHAKIQIGSVKTGHENRRLLQLQERHDVLLHLRRRRGREGADDRPLGQRLQRGGDGAIARPKIMTPLADAMGFIDHAHRHIEFTEKIEK